MSPSVIPGVVDVVTVECESKSSIAISVDCHLHGRWL